MASELGQRSAAASELIEEAVRLVAELELEDELRVPAFLVAVELLRGSRRPACPMALSIGDAAASSYWDCR